MEGIFNTFEMFLPALITFGPLFLITVVHGEEDPRGPKSRTINNVGLAMVTLAMFGLSFSIHTLQGKVITLEQRIQHLEKHVHPSLQFR